MISNDKLMVPYYKSETWRNLLETRLQTLKEDSLFLKQYAFYNTTIKEKKRNLSMELKVKCNRTKDSFYNFSRIENEIVEDSPQDLNEVKVLKNYPFFRKRSIGIPCLRMKAKLNQKSKIISNPGLTTLLFPSINNIITKPKKTTYEENKRKYLVFLKQKSIIKTHSYYLP